MYNHRHLTHQSFSSSITLKIVGLLSGNSLVQRNAIFPRIAASGSVKFPFRLLSIKFSKLQHSAADRIELESSRLPERIWKMITPYAKTSLFSVKRPVVIYSGAI